MTLIVSSSQNRVWLCIVTAREPAKEEKGLKLPWSQQQFPHLSLCHHHRFSFTHHLWGVADCSPSAVSPSLSFHQRVRLLWPPWLGVLKGWPSLCQTTLSDSLILLRSIVQVQHVILCLVTFIKYSHQQPIPLTVAWRIFPVLLLHIKLSKAYCKQN